MGQAEVTVTIEAPVEKVFDFVDEPSNTPRFMRGISRYDPVGSTRTGLGAVYASIAVIVGREFDVELEVTGWRQNEMLTAASRKGPKTRGTWRFEKIDEGTTEATLLYEYDLPMVFRFVPGVNSIIEGDLRKSLAQLRTLVEAEALKGAPKKPRSGAKRRAK